jgi:thioesterase domain-containing protein
VSIPRLPRLDGSDELVFPASFGQQSLWLLDQVRSHRWDYNVPFAFRIQGALDVDALARSFSFLVRRHEVLRTTLRAVDGNPMQFIAPAWNVRIPAIDLRELPSTERVRRTRELIDDEAWTPFDLAQGPLMRIKLLRTDDEENVLVINFHQSIFDNWSREILMRELLASYQAFFQGRQPELPELPIQYADYAHWQRELRPSRRFAGQLQYWRNQLSDLPVSRLPMEPAPRTKSVSVACVATQPIELSLQLVDALKNMGESEGATFFMTMLAAFQVLLAQYSGQEDIVVSSPVADRRFAEAEPLIGFFVNTLVLRTRLCGNPTFRAVVRRVRDMTLEAHRNQDLPFESVVEAVASGRDLSRHPLCHVMFSLLKSPPKWYSVRDLRFEPVEFEVPSPLRNLAVSLFDEPDGVRGYLNYNADLFAAETVRGMAQHFRALVEDITANPEARISELPLLAPPEPEQLFVKWKNTGRADPTNVCHQDLIERTPDTIAHPTVLQVKGGRPTWSPVVAIQPRGSRSPFFGVHTVSGEVMLFRGLARCLGEDQPFYGIRSEGRAGGPTRHTSIETIASYYIDEIRRVQPHGPYYLGGYCMGGVVAFEMAQQLHAAGEAVALLALFETDCPEPTAWSDNITKQIRLAFGEAASLSPRDRLRYFTRRVIRKVKRQIAQRQHMGDRLAPERSYTTAGYPTVLGWRVGMMLVRAQSRYEPRAYPGRVVLFCAGVTGGDAIGNDRGWSGIAKGGLEIHDIPGDHQTIFEPQYVEAVAKKLGACIQAAGVAQMCLRIPSPSVELLPK